MMDSDSTEKGETKQWVFTSNWYPPFVHLKMYGTPDKADMEPKLSSPDWFSQLRMDETGEMEPNAFSPEEVSPLRMDEAWEMEPEALSPELFTPPRRDETPESSQYVVHICS